MTTQTKSVGDDPMEQGMSYVEKLDFREQAHQHELAKLKATEAEATKRAKYHLRAERQETYQIIGVAFFVLVLLLAIIAWIYFSTAGDPTPGPTGPGSEERREIACVANGGGFIPEDLLNESADHGVCVYPGRASGS